MDMILELINKCGFPIAMVILLFSEMKKERETNREEINHLSEVIQNNTIVVQQIVDKIEQLIK